MIEHLIVIGKRPMESSYRYSRVAQDADGTYSVYRLLN